MFKFFLMSKRKIKPLCSLEKLNIVREFENNISVDELMKKYSIGKSTVYKIIQKKNEIQLKCAEGQGKIKRKHLAEFPDVEESVISWITQCVQNNVPVNGPLIKEKASHFASKLQKDNF